MLIIPHQHHKIQSVYTPVLLKVAGAYFFQNLLTNQLECIFLYYSLSALLCFLSPKFYFSGTPKYIYLRTLGFDVTNDIFAENAWYFRNALVRANYTNLQKGVHETTEYLEAFLRNLLLGEENELKNRYLHISGTLEDPKCHDNSKNVTLDVTLDESVILELIKTDPQITQERIASSINKSSRTVKRTIDSLKAKGIISREGGKRFGYWKVNN